MHLSSVPEAVNQLFFLAALGIWTGGIFVLSIAAPLVFAILDSRTQAGALVAALIGKLNQLKLIGTCVLFVTSVVAYFHWEPEISGTLAARYALIGAMVALASTSAFVIAPALQRLNREIGSIDREEVTPNRRRFGKLHTVNSTVTAMELGCGIAVLYTV